MTDAGEMRARYRRITRFAARYLAQAWWYELFLPRIGLGSLSARGRAARLTRIARRFHALAVDLGGLIKHDFERGTRETWDPGPTSHSGEWLFVPGGSDTADDAGWLFGFVHDDATGVTHLTIVDATDVPAGPVASIEMPQRVPYGFHGTWIPG